MIGGKVGRKGGVLGGLARRTASLVLRSVTSNRIVNTGFLVAGKGRRLICTRTKVTSQRTRGPVRQGAVFQLCSVAGPIATITTVVLVREKVLSLCRPMTSVLPTFTRRGIRQSKGLCAPREPVLVRSLLTVASKLMCPRRRAVNKHTIAGIFRRTYTHLRDSRPIDARRVTRGVTTYPLMFTPKAD